MRHRTAIAALVIVGGLLAGCSGSDDYCDALESAQSDFGDLDTPSAGDLERLMGSVEELSGQAPDGIDADWQRLETGFEDLQKALDDAGITVSDLEGLQAGDLPEGVDQADVEAVAEKMSGFGDGLEEASERISEHSEKECGIKLG